MKDIYPIKPGNFLIVTDEELTIRAFTDEYDKVGCLVHGEMVGNIIPAGETLLCIGFKRCTCHGADSGGGGVMMAMFLTSKHGIVCEHVSTHSFKVRWGDWYSRTTLLDGAT